MARRPDLQRIVTARREGQLSRLRSQGLTSDRALTELRKIEAWARAQGMDPTERRYWDAVRTVLDEEHG